MIDDGPAWRYIDWDLARLPTALFDPGDHRWVDWTYLVDLDRELFCVKNWIVFDLWNVPCDRWIQALGCDDQGHEVFDFGLCPEALRSIALPSYFPKETGERDTYRRIYHEYQPTALELVAVHSQIWQQSTGQVLAMAVFEIFTNSLELPFWDYLSGYCHNGFAFREIAFAILSLAAGNFTFDMPDQFYGKEYQGYLIDVNEGGQPILMPLFGSGCHMLDQKPGSSPCDDLYCLGGVIVSLVPDSAFEEDMEAAIAKAVTYGVTTGRTAFSALLFSIYQAVLIEVRTQNHAVRMRHTKVFQVYEDRWKNIGVEHDEHSGTATPTNVLDQLYLAHPGFAALQQLFNTVAQRRVPSCDQGTFPLEIYAIIISYADTSTREACAQVSQTFYTLCQGYFSFTKDITVSKFETASLHGETFSNGPKSSVDLAGLGQFSFRDHKTGQIVQSCLNVSRQVRVKDENQISTWCPVIGEKYRPSLMRSVQLRLLLR